MSRAEQTAVSVSHFHEVISQLRDEQSSRETRQKEKDERDLALHLATRITPCDGSNPQTVRQWIRQIGLTVNYSYLTVFIASQSSGGELQRELEHYLDLQPDRKAVTWTQLKKHIQEAFLAPHEDDRMRNELDKVKQGAYENTASYGRRFREMARQAYPNDSADGNQNDAEVRVLLKAYVRGLRERSVVERLFREGHPANYRAAIKLVAQNESDDYRMKAAIEDGFWERQEEPMDVIHVASKALTQKDDPKLLELDRKISGLTTQFTKLMATLKQTTASPAITQMAQPTSTLPKSTPNTSTGTDQHSFTQSGAPICNFCKNIGHIQRHCRKRQHQQRTGRPIYGAQGGY